MEQPKEPNREELLEAYLSGLEQQDPNPLNKPQMRMLLSYGRMLSRYIQVREALETCDCAYVNLGKITVDGKEKEISKYVCKAAIPILESIAAKYFYNNFQKNENEDLRTHGVKLRGIILTGNTEPTPSPDQLEELFQREDS